jgi:3,4-dihydroxy 2-butanone 4-phosphate synthase/GTP cyclohydrolase II
MLATSAYCHQKGVAAMSSVQAAIEAIKRGEIAVVSDDEHRENEGDLIMAAQAATPDKIAFYLEHSSGLICVSLPGERCDELNLPPMVADNRDPKGTAFTVSVDVAAGVTTGISAADRALTLRALANSSSVASDFNRPGHIFPLRSRPGGVLKRAGHTEATTDLVRMAGLGNVGALCEVVTRDRLGMARVPELKRLASVHAMPFVTVADLVRYRMANERLVEYISRAAIPTPYGEFECHVWQSTLDGVEHVALTHGKVDGGDPIPVRVHSECLTGDIFGSKRCDCGTQLDDAIRYIAIAGAGAVVYLRGHEGRGIGLGHKLRAYNLQDAGYDTVDANLMLGLPVDSREYGIGAQMLVDLGVTQMRLITNNPAKYEGLTGFGIDIVERIALPIQKTSQNVRYLESKRQRMGHLFPTFDGTEQTTSM